MKEEIRKVVEFYKEEGIVTRSEVRSMDLRAFGRKLVNEMKNYGFPEAVYEEFNLENYVDYSGVIYNPNVVSRYEAKKYMIENVLVNYEK